VTGILPLAARVASAVQSIFNVVQFMDPSVGAFI